MEFQLKCILRQETVMIHFQHDTQGACLRGSEVKPKLDRFIREYYEKDHKEKVPDEWYLDDSSGNHALDYKLRVKRIGGCRDIDLVSNVYFGNTGSGKKGSGKKGKNEEERKGIWCPHGLELTILCFIPALLKEIESKLEAFFLMTNFGTRQSKGLGSFRVVELVDNEGNLLKLAQEDELLEVVKKYARGPVYVVKNQQSEKTKNNQNETIDLYDDDILNAQLTEVKIKELFFTKINDLLAIHNLMKSGINYKNNSETKKYYFKGFSIRYYLRKNPPIKSDKALMKGYFFHSQKFDEEKKEYQEEYKFFRAFLGLVDHYKFKNTLRDDKIRRKDQVAGGTIDVFHKDIKRFQSPITHKIFDNYMLMLIGEVPDELLNQEFEFSLKAENNQKSKRSISIKTPETFDICNFVEEFVKDFNCKKGVKGRCDLENAQIVFPVGKLRIEKLK